MKLKLSKDRKVTAKAKLNGNTWVPEIPNAFGLPAHVSCPGKTKVCEEICYAFKLEKAYTNVAKLLKHNWDLLQSAGNTANMAVLLHTLIEDYLHEHERVERLRDETYPKIFRIHWDGDFFSKSYARAWKYAIESHPEIKFWAYTRSFCSPVNVVPILDDIPNLALYLSVDSVNLKKAKRVFDTYGVRIAALDDTFAEAQSVSLSIADKPSPKCPEQTGRYSLVEPNGKGACAECMMCINGTNDVLFSISKK